VKIRKVWKRRHQASGAAHVVIAIIAALTSADVLTASNRLLAILIAWANICTALHRFGNDS
jgi:hypothetical protein